MSRERVVAAAMSLRSMSPELWDQFVDAVRAHSAETTQAMTTCDPSMLTRAQGMAIAMQELAQILRDAPTLAEHISRGKPHGQASNNRRA